AVECALSQELYFGKRNPDISSVPGRRSRNHPVQPFGGRRDHRPPSTPSQWLKPTLLGHSASHSERLFLCRVSDTGPLMIDPPVLMAGAVAICVGIWWRGLR